jgi:DNA-binding Lrp family transcriptional regulator
MSKAADATDRAILRLLRINGRAQFRDRRCGRAVAVGLSAADQAARGSGVIRGYTAVIGPEGEEDNGVDVVVQVTLDRQTEEYLSRFEHAVQWPEIRNAS